MELAFPSATFDYKRVAKKGRASANMEYDGTSNVLPHWRFQPNPGKMGIPIGAATLCHRDTSDANATRGSEQYRFHMSYVYFPSTKFGNYNGCVDPAKAWGDAE